MSARRELVAAVAERYRTAERGEKGRILDELTAVTGWHRKHAVRALSANGRGAKQRRCPQRTYGEAIRDALIALWEASDRVCGKRLKVMMIPVLLPALERHGRLHLGATDRALLLAVSATTIDRMLSAVRIAARGGRRRRAGFSSAIRREVPVRTFDGWNDPPPGFCEADLVAHGGMSVTGSLIQTLTVVDVTTGWTECFPLLVREGTLVVQAIERAQSLIPWLIRGLDFDNDSAFMNDVVVPWCRAHGIEVTRSRAYKKNDQAFVEQKNGAVVRRLVGYGRFEGVEAARALGRLYPQAGAYVRPAVRVEGGAKSAIDPHRGMTIKPYIAEDIPDLDLAVDDVTTIEAERTLWDKVVIVHGLRRWFERRGVLRQDGHRVSRHYYDLHCLTQSDHGRAALAHDALAIDCVQHARMFFDRPDYDLATAIRGSFAVAPSRDMLDALRRDYAATMQMIFGAVPSFDEIMESVTELDALVNEARQ